jgi:hypothetical protein
MRPSLNRTTEIKARCIEEVKEQLCRKLIASRYSHNYKQTVNPDLVNFVEVLSSKSLEWFQENFSKSLDKLE